MTAQSMMDFGIDNQCQTMLQYNNKKRNKNDHSRQ